MSLSRPVPQAARRSSRPNLLASQWASDRRCWAAKERPKQQVHTPPNLSRRGRTCTKVGVNSVNVSVLKKGLWRLCSHYFTLSSQTTPALLRTKGHGGKESQGWWGNLSRRSRLLASRSEWGWTTVLLHSQTRSVLSYIHKDVINLICILCMSNNLNYPFLPLRISSSLCLWLWRSAVIWWRRGGWSTRASTESRGTTRRSPTCRRSSTTRAWMISMSRMMWVTPSILCCFNYTLLEVV